MDFNLGAGQLFSPGGCETGGRGGKVEGAPEGELDRVKRRNSLIKDEIEGVKQRIAGLKTMSGKAEYLSIPTSFVSNPAPILLISTDLQLHEANESFARLADLKAEDLLFGSDVLELFTEDSKQRVKASMAQLVKSGTVDQFEAELVSPSGKKTPVIVFPTKMGPTNTDCFVFFLDMAARKAMQKELAIKQSNLAALAESIPQMIWVSGPEGAITYANEHFRKFTGLGYEKAPGDSVAKDSAATRQINREPGSANPAISDAVSSDWRQILASEDRNNFPGAVFSLGHTYADFQVEVRLRNAEGAYLWHLLKVVPFFTSGGSSMHWLNLATEIDEQKRLADSLVVAEEQLRVIADAMPQIVWTADSRGNVDFLNHRWFEYTGLTGEQSLHGGWRLLIHSEDLPKYEESWRRAVKASEPFEVEFRLKRVLGLGGRSRSQAAFRAKTSAQKAEPRRDYLWHLCRAVPLKTSQGQVIRWFGTWTEIDEHKARE